jgi:hypothetical protein
MIRAARAPFILLIVVLAFLSACSKVSDDSITTNIKARMFSEPLLKSASVSVSSKDGVVTITGVVPDDAARLAARQIASQTNGVKQVIDSTTMAPPAPQYSENMTPAPQPPAAPAPAPVKPARKKKEAPAPVDNNTQQVADNSAPPPAAPPTQPQPDPGPIQPAAAPAPAPPPPPPPPPPQPVTITIPDGAVISVRTIDSIDSKTASSGQSFRASLDAPVVVGDQVVLPKGLNARLKIVEASSAGNFKGTSELTVSLDTITYQGKTYAFSSSDVQQKGASRGKRSAAVIGGGTVLGALIGGLAGGGKGAAIGAGVGAGTGTVVQATTHGQQVKIPAETPLDFTLHTSVAVTFLPKKKPVPAAATTAPEPAPAAAPASTDQTAPPQQ